MKRTTPCLVLVLVACSLVSSGASDQKAEKKLPAGKKLLIAFASYRERPRHPNIFFYEHDGVDKGKIVGSVGTQRSMASADAGPALSLDGRYCLFTYEKENNTSRIFCWDRNDSKLVDLPKINTSPNAQLAPNMSRDVNRVAFTAWNHPSGPGAGWHLFLYDKPGKKLLDTPGLNVQSADSRMPSMTADGQFLVFASNRPGGAGLTDLYLYDVKAGKVAAIKEANSPATEIDPAFSADGKLLAFASQRPGGVGGGAGGRDIYLLDRTTGKLVPLPGLNTPANEYTPGLSPDGRYIVFASERVDGAGERDIYLYDRDQAKLLPTPDLNSKTEDFDPCIIATPN